MQIIQALAEISSKFLNSILWKLFILLNQLIEIATSTIFEDDPKMVPSLIPVEKFEYVSVFQVMKDSDFVEHFFTSVLLDRLDSNIINGLLFPTLY